MFRPLGGRLKPKPVRLVETKQRLMRIVMEGDLKNPQWRYHYCGSRTLPVDVQQRYEGENDG